MPVQLIQTPVERQDGDTYIAIRDGKPVNILAHGDGLSVLNGTTVPSPELGMEGEFYIRTSNWTIYGPKSGGSWGSAVNMLGVEGTDGTNGVDGADGSVWTVSAGAPSGGVNGDMHLHTGTYDVYRKASGTWSVVGNIKGADGTNGTNGTNGTDGIDGIDGADGSDFPAMTVSTKAAAYTAVTGDFAGNVLLKMTSASAVNLTINTGLTGTEPLQVLQYGAGQITINGTATRRHAIGAKTRAQYSLLSIIPIGTDEYLIVGDAAA